MQERGETPAGDVRFRHVYEALASAPDSLAAVRALSDEQVVYALAGATGAGDSYLANVLAVEASNRLRRAQAAVRWMGDGTLAVDEDGRIVFANPTAGRLLGREPAALVGLQAHATLHPSCKDPCELVEALRTKGIARAEAETFFRADGSGFPTAYTATAVEREGAWAGVVVVFEDATEREATRRRLAESEERYRSLFEYHPDIILTVDAAGIVVTANPASETVSGYAPAEVVGTPFVSYVADEHRELAAGAFADVLAGRVRVERFSIVRKDGSRRDLVVTGVPVVVGGEVVGVHGIGRDVTALREAEEGRRESEERFRALVDAAFEGIVIHEQGRILEANPAWLRMVGVTAEEAVGRDLLDFVAPESRDVVRSAHRDGRTTPYRISVRRADGSTFPAEAVGKDVRYRGRHARVAAVRARPD